MMMKLFCTLALASTLACHAASGPAATRSPAQTPSPTDDVALNHLIAATLNGNKRALLEAVGGTKIGCVRVPSALGSPPPCRTGEADGTLIDAFGLGGCDGSLIRTADAYAAVYQVTTPARLFAVGAPLDPGESHADYLVLFTDGLTGASASNGFMWEVRDGTIVGYIHSCNSIQELLAFVSPPYLVAPPP